MAGLRMVPVNIDEDLWVQALRAAAARGTTVSAIVQLVLERLVDDDPPQVPRQREGP